MVVASKAGIRVLCMVANGSCSKLRSAVVSPVVTVAFVNRLILNFITTLAIELFSYYELPNTVYTYFSMSSANSFSIKSNFDQFVLTFSLMF